MTTTTNTFELPGSYKKWTIGLIAAGIIALLYGLIMFHPFAAVAHDANDHAIKSIGTRFWAVLLQNSVFWLLICNASMFFLVSQH